MKTNTLVIAVVTALTVLPLLAADPSPSAPPPTLPAIDDYKKQDAVVADLKKKLAAESAKLNAMKSTFTDCAARALPTKPGQTGPIVEVDHDEFKKRYKDFQTFEGEKKAKAIAQAKKDGDYFPFQIRRTVLGDKESLDPASVSYLSNNHGADSYAIDAGFLLDLPELTKELNTGWGDSDALQLSPFAEYHRNTASSALNDTLTLGTQVRFTLDRDDDASDFFQYIDLNTGWKNESLTEGKSFFAQLQYTPLMRCYRLGLFGNQRLLPGDAKPGDAKPNEWDQLRIVPTVALAYQRVYDGILPSIEGDNLILKASADIEYFPKRWMFGVLEDKLVLRAGYTFWSYLTHTEHVSVPDRNMSFFHASADYYIDGKRPGPSDPSTGHDGHYAIGLEYTRGDNPDTGAYDADQLLLSFRVFF
jgi:hypothetical protein